MLSRVVPPRGQILLLSLALPLVIAGCELGTLPPGVTPTDALKLTHLCADSFQITNRFIQGAGEGLSIDLYTSWPIPGGRSGGHLVSHVSVPWAKSAAEPGMKQFRIPIPSGVLVSVNAQPNSPSINGILMPGITATNSGPAVCTVTKIAKVRLRTITGLGVSGSTTPASDSVPDGSTLSWQFAPSDGASDVDVRINGAVVGRSGARPISGETVITAVGVFSHGTSVEIAPLVSQMRALLNSGSPRSDVQSLVNNLVALLDRVDEATGDRLLAEFQSQALASDADVDAMIRLDESLAGALLPITIPGQPAFRGAEQTFPGEPTAYFVAAGILTTQDKVVATARVVRALIRDRGMLGANDLIRSFVSPTMTGLNQDARRCIARIFSLPGIRERVNGFLTFCLPVYGGLLDSNDFIEASSQILKQWVGGIPSRQTSLAFMDSLQHYRGLGFHIITDAHSQGTLIAREAITELGNRGLYLPATDSICLGVVAMAGPVSGNWPMPLTYFREFATDGDIVAASGGSTALRIPTDLTRERDSALASVSKLNIPLRAALNLMYGLKLHDLQDVYLGEAPPRNYLLASNLAIRRECETAGIQSALGDHVQISKGEELPIGLYVSVVNYNGHTMKQPIRQIVSQQPNIADMINATTVLGKAIGDAPLVVTAAGHERIITVSVRPAPLLGIGGSYAGTWRITQPGVTGALGISLAEVGAVTRNGEPMVTGTVTYGYSTGTYTVPMLDGIVSLGGVYPTIRFRMSTPEFTNPDSWANVSLEIHGNGTLSGGATLYYQGGLVRENRGWDVTRQ